MLFLIIKRAGKKDFDLTWSRVARDPERIPSDAQLRLTGAKAKRDKAMADTAASLYPPGSVVPWVEAPPPPDPVEVEAEERKQKKEAADAQAAVESSRRGKWLWPVVAVGGALVIGGIIAITIIETRPGPTGSPITLP